MSGYKYSYFRIEASRTRRMEFVGKIEDERKKLSSLMKRLTKELDSAPDGLKKTFHALTTEVQDWIQRAENRRAAKVSEEGDVPYLKNTLGRFTDMVEEGQKHMEKTLETFTVRADRMEKNLIMRLSRLEADFDSKEENIETWLPANTPGIRELLKKIAGEIKNKDFGRAEAFLTEAKLLLDKSVEKAHELEMKHQKRLYLLKSLRQVCSEMGFEETKAPDYQDEKDRTKPIEFEVDTLDQGKISFYLSLDGIRTFSEIMDGKCISEFDRLSEYLEEEFGVKTQFAHEEDKPDDVLIAKGELEIPGEDSVMYMEK